MVKKIPLYNDVIKHVVPGKHDIIEDFLGAKIEKNEDQFLTNHIRPKYSKDVKTVSYPWANENKMAIILQGPVKKEDDFTIETIKVYQKHFPNDLLILSTWEDEDKEYLDQLSHENLIVIYNKKPGNPGLANINYQIFSSYAGVLYAKKHNCSFALKTRTDQRIYAIDVKEFLFGLIHTIPLECECLQRYRIIGCSLNTFKYRPYGLSDMTIFGHIDDMMKFWGVGFDHRDPTTRCGPSIRDFMGYRVAETYLFTKFLESIGRSIKWTLSDSWDAFADHTCIIDQESLDIYWPKYSNYREYRRIDYARSNGFQELTFRDWLTLYAKRNALKPVFENILEQKYDDPITFT